MMSDFSDDDCGSIINNFLRTHFVSWRSTMFLLAVIILDLDIWEMKKDRTITTAAIQLDVTPSQCPEQST